jgi:hypothetical protein
LKKFVCVPFVWAVASLASATVNVSTPTTETTTTSPVHFVAAASSTCSKGVSAMGIYTAPYVLAYSGGGASLNTSLKLSPGSYNIVVQEWDNCGGATKTPIALTVAESAKSAVYVTAPTTNTSATSPVHFVATATSACSKGVSAMGIYTAPYVLAYSVEGASLNTSLSLSPGTYNVVVQEWDNCGGATKTPMTLTVTSSNSNAMSCPSGTEDMMNYFSMGSPNQKTKFMGPGNANPIYTTVVPDYGASYAKSGYLVWTKSSARYPWDVKTFDQNYIYDRTTELSWTDATSFKRFSYDLPMSPRCVAVGQPAPAIKVPPAKTNFSFYESCAVTNTQNLGYVINEISAPAMVNTEGNLGTIQSREFNYQYSCNSNYGNCKYKEVFTLGYHIGLYDWKYYLNENGSWVLQQESKINNLDSGSLTPYLPCSNSY